MRSNDIGNIGESHFNCWCAEASIVINQSRSDMKGWDFIIQFTNDKSKTTPNDISTEEITAFIQVKTTKTPSTPVYITLSNWNSLIRNPVPAFILYIILNDDNSINKVFMTHIYKEIITNVLLKLRSSRKKPNKEKLKYCYTQSDIIETPNGQTIKSKILTTVKDGFDFYCSKKIDLIKNIGYSEITNRGRFKIQGRIDDIIDFSLGLKKELQVTELILETGIRFDIPEKVESFDSALMRIQPVGKSVKIELENSFGLCSTHEAELLTPFGLVNSLSKKQIRFRIKSEIFDFILSFENRSEINFHIELPKFDTVNKLVNLAKTALILNDKNKYFTFRILNSEGDDISWKIPIEKNDSSNFSPIFLENCKTILQFSKVIGMNYIDSSIKIQLEDILKQKIEINEYIALIEENETEVVTIGFTLDSLLDENKMISIPRMLKLYLGEKTLIVKILYLGIPILEHGDSNKFRYRVFSKGNLINSTSYRNISKIKIEEEWNNFVQSLDEEKNMVVILN